MFQKNSLNKLRRSESGNAVVVVLVVLVVVAVGALAYLSSQMNQGDAAAEVALTETASGETNTAEANVEEAVETATTEPAEAPVEGAAEQTPAEIAEGNPVVAKVGDEEITRLDVLNYIQTLPPQMRQVPLQQLFALAQDQVINSKLLESKVDAKSLADDEEVQQQLETAKKQIVRNVFIQREIEERMTEERLKKAYDKYKEEFPETQEAKARHILVETEEKAADLIAQLEEGADFAELAKEHSTDGTAEGGGELGYFAKSDVVPEFAEATFELKKGTYTKEPVQTQFGYHVIKLEDKRQRPVPSFEETKQFLQSNLRREVLDEIMQEWREDANIQRFDINGKELDSKVEAESN